MIPASEVAKYLIHLAAGDGNGEPMTAMRLHYLLYYCQGWYLAWYGRPLFPERRVAGKDGPLVPAVQELPGGLDTVHHTDGRVEISNEMKKAIEQA